MKVLNRQTIRFIWGAFIVVAVLFGLNLLLVRSGSERRFEGYPIGSTYSTDPGGAELIYRLFDQIGLNVIQHRNPLVENLMPDERVDVIWHSFCSATVPVEEVETSWVEQWVYDGGTLVLIDNPEEESNSASDPYSSGLSDLLIDDWYDRFDISCHLRDVMHISDRSELNSIHHRMPVGVSGSWGPGEISEIHTYQKHGLVGPVVSRITPTSASNRDIEPLIRDGYGTVLARVQYGDGQVWLISDPYLFSNLLVQEADNAMVAVSMMLGSRGGDFTTVLFDEYHLGFVQSRTILDAARTPFGKGILYLGLIFALAIGTAGARFGPTRKAQNVIGVSQKAFVKALAGLWMGANATTAAADALFRRYSLKQNVRRRGIDVKLDNIRKSKPRVDDLIDIACDLDS